MCVVSMIYDHFSDKWDNDRPRKPTLQEIADAEEIIRKAKEYDKKNNEPDCETQEKKDRLKRLAEEYGINIKFED